VTARTGPPFSSTNPIRFPNCWRNSHV
jgi:hypothetical protein